MTLGIDNGVSGAWCLLEGGKIIDMGLLPTKGKPRHLDARTLFAQWQGYLLFDLCAAVERPAGSQSMKAATSMADCYGSLRTILELMGTPYRSVTCHEWRKFHGISRGDPKAKALTLATKIWPEEDWLPTSRSRTPHSGLYEASLIALYCERSNSSP